MRYLAFIAVCIVAAPCLAQSPETMGYLLSGGTMTVQRDGTVQAVGSTLVPTKPEKPVLRDVFYQALPPMYLQGNKFGIYYGSGLQLSGSTLTATGGGGTTYSAVAPLYVTGGTVLSIGGGTNSVGLNLGSGSLNTSGNISLSSSLATLNFGSGASVYLDGDNDLVLASKAGGAQIEITDVGAVVLTATNDFVVIGPSALDSAAVSTDGSGNMYVAGTGAWNSTASNSPGTGGGPYYSFVVNGGPVAFDHGNIITSGSGTMAMKVLQLAGTDGSFGTIAESAAGSVMTMTSTGGIVANQRLAVSDTAGVGALFSITSSAQTTYLFQWGADASAGLTLYPAVASNASFRFNNSLFGSTVLDIDTSNLRVGIGAVGAPKYTLDVSGGTTATGSLLLGTSGSPITLLLANSAGLVGPVALGSNLSFSGSTLNASGSVTGLTASTGITVGSGATPAVAVSGQFGGLNLSTTGAVSGGSFSISTGTWVTSGLNLGNGSLNCLGIQSNANPILGLSVAGNFSDANSNSVLFANGSLAIDVAHGGSILLATTASTLSTTGAGGISFTGGTLGNLGFSTTNSMLRLGSLEFQPYALNNCWFGDNVYYDGGFFRYRSAGAGGFFYFLSPEGQFRMSSSGTAGQIISPTGVQFRIDASGGCAVGGIMPNAASGENNWYGATLICGSNGNVGIGMGNSTSASLPGSLLTVGSASTFTVDQRGNTAVSGSLTFSGTGGQYSTIKESTTGGTNTTSTLTISPSGNYGQTQFNGQYNSHGCFAVTLTNSAATIDWNNGNRQRVVLANANTGAGNTLTLVNAVDGGTYQLIVVQPASGSGTVTWAATGTTVKWPAATAPTLSSTVNYEDIVSFLCDGTAGWIMGGANLGYH